MQEQADERVSARFEKNMIEEMDETVAREGYANRSEFLRTAARILLDTRQHENAIMVEVPPLMKEYIDAMVDRGYYRDHAHAVQAAIDHYFTGERTVDACNAAKQMEITAGKKIDARLEKSTPRHMIDK